MTPDIKSHQSEIQRAFQWIEFAYEQGKSLIDLATAKLEGAGLPPSRFSSSCNTFSRSVPWRYVYLDTDWYLPTDNEPYDKGFFVALSYHSSDWLGCHLIFGSAELEERDAGLLKRPTQIGHWLLEFAAHPTDNPRKLRAEPRADGLIDHLPDQELPADYRKGLRKIVSAPFAAASIDSDQRLSQLVEAFAVFIATGEGKSLGELSRSSRISAESSRINF